MTRRTLKEIMRTAEHQDERSIGQIMADLYEIPLGQLYEPGFRAYSKYPQYILADLDIPAHCIGILNLGEIACLVNEYYTNGSETRDPQTTLIRLSQLGNRR